MRSYPVQFEIAGPAAIFTRPDSGASPVSYPAPTCSAAKGMFECVARWKTACIRPTEVRICRPLQYYRYTTNYRGPLRKDDQRKKDNAFQFFATILIDVCYQVKGEVVEINSPPGRENHLHALQDLFRRRLRRGQLHRTPCLGWSEFTPSYFGEWRPETKACEEVDDLLIPSMLHQVFDSLSAGRYAPTFRQGLVIHKGVLSFC